jgi:ribonucleoside-diphosphate reductase alpha chain
MRDEAYKASALLSAEKGSFPEYTEEYLSRPFTLRLPDEIRSLIRENGIRNCYLLTQAPTGTTSLVAGVNSGIEPYFDFRYKRIDRIGERWILSPYASRYYTDGGSGERRNLPDDELVIAEDVTPIEHIRMQSAAQKYIDSSISKCLAEGTLLPTSEGLKTIESFSEIRSEDTFVRLEGNITTGGHRILSHYSAGAKKATKVRLDNGVELVGATESHKILTPEGWTLMSSLEPGDVVVGRLEESHGLGGLPLTWDDVLRVGANVDLIRPTHMSVDFAKILGMICADGIMSLSAGRVGICSKDDEVDAEFKRLSLIVFGKEPNVTIDKRNGVRSLFVTSRNLARFVESLIGSGAYYKHAPQSVISGSAEEKIAFLNGVTLDGYLTPQGLYVYFGMSKELAYHTSEMCRSFGMHKVSVTTKRVEGASHKGSLAYGVCISNDVQDLIDPIESRKKAKASHYQTYRVVVDPLLYDKDNRVSAYHTKYSTMRNMWQRGSLICDNLTAKSFGWATDLLAYRVRSVEDAGTLQMFDVEVEDSHDYVVNGIISHNTINAAEDTTVEDVERLYMQAWTNDLKSLSIYRDKSRDKQVLNHAEEIKPVEVMVAPVAVRRRLPKNRDAITHKFNIGEQEGYLTVGMYEDKTPGEVFVRVSKQGSTVGGLMDVIALLMSFCLQYGVPLEVLVEKLSGMMFEPSGYTGNSDMPFTTSIPDYLVRWMSKQFSTETQEPIHIPEAVIYGKVTGEVCIKCGGIMRRAEGCIGCPSCGWEKCGG